jgi:hypothetical protein
MNEQMQKTIEEIKDYAGGRARLWKYTASHDRLTIQITKKDEINSKYLHLVMCENLELPVIWELISPLIKKNENGYWVFCDKNVRIIFQECGIYENAN